MATKEQVPASNSKTDREKDKPRSATYFDRAISTDVEFAQMSLAVMGDLINGRLTPDVGNSVCANGRNVLKVVELKYKYGKTVSDGHKVLQLAARA